MNSNTFLDGVLVESVVDHGDGTGTHTDFTTEPPTVTQLTGLPLPEPEVVDPMTALLAKLSEATSLAEVREAALEAQEALQ